jgi:hypothetical protein
VTPTRPLFLFSLILACGGKAEDADADLDTAEIADADTDVDLDTDDPDEAVETVEMEAEADILFDVTGGPYDLAADGQGRVYCSVRESRLVIWDPLVGWIEEVSDDLGPIFGIALAGDAVYFTTSEHRQAGSFARLIDGEVEVIATAAGSTIFREPTDLAMAPDGDWVLADKTLETLIGVSESGEAWLIPSPGSVSTVAFKRDTLFFGGEDGIWSMAWPDGEAVLVDARSANGLHAWEDKMWATNIGSRVYEVGGTLAISIEDVRVPGRMTGTDTLYLADWGLADVWAIEP